jgi:hypothetical protein
MNTIFRHVTLGTGPRVITMGPLERPPRDVVCPAWMRLNEPRHRDGLEFVVDTDASELVPLAWSRAADTIARWPPDCPRLDSASAAYAAVLERIWPEWVRMLTHLAVRYPADMEVWAHDFVSDSAFEIASGIVAVFERWNRDYPVDLWAIHQRALGNLKPGRSLPRWKPQFQRDPKFRAYRVRGRGISFIPEFSNRDGLLALASVLAWRKGISATPRPGLLEARWFRWPVSGEPLLSLHLSHPGLPHPESRSARQKRADSCPARPASALARTQHDHLRRSNNHRHD